MVSHGLTDIPITNLNKEKAIQDILVAEVIITRVLPMNKFFDGLDCMGLGKILRQHPAIVGPQIFPRTVDACAGLEQVKAKSLNVITDDSSNKERQAIQWYHAFIKDSAELTGVMFFFSNYWFVVTFYTIILCRYHNNVEEGC